MTHILWNLDGLEKWQKSWKAGNTDIRNMRKVTMSWLPKRDKYEFNSLIFLCAAIKKNHRSDKDTVTVCHSAFRHWYHHTNTM